MTKIFKTAKENILIVIFVVYTFLTLFMMGLNRGKLEFLPLLEYILYTMSALYFSEIVVKVFCKNMHKITEYILIIYKGIVFGCAVFVNYIIWVQIIICMLKKR